MVLPFLALGALALGGVVSAVGAKKQAEETNRGIDKANNTPLVEKSDLNLPKLVSESEKAGFNPLTVLRAGGVAGYATHTTTGHNAHLFAQRQSPGGAFLGGIGNMLGNVGSAGLQHFQHMSSLNTSLRVAEMSAMSSFGGGGFGGRGTGSAYGGTPYGGAPLGVSLYDQWENEVPGVTNPSAFDWWQSNPYLPDTETGWEARYGDVVGTIGGVGNVAGDVLWNANTFFGHVDKTLRDWGQKVRGGMWNWLDQGLPSSGGGNAPPLSLTVGGPNQTGL